MKQYTPSGVASRLKDIDARMQRWMRDWNVPGVAVGITDKNRVLFARGYGYRDAKRRLPVTERTNFAVCSCTKAFTATSIGILADDGGIEWDRPIRDFVPSFRMYDPVLTERLTVRDLLCHRSGLEGHDSAWIWTSETRAQLVERAARIIPNRDLRTTYQYNNFIYMRAGHLVEEITGTPWEEFVRQRIFGPLGMATSQFATDPVPLTDDYSCGHVGNPLKPVFPFHQGSRESSLAAAFGPIGPAGTIASNVIDMCRWVRMHMNGGVVTDGENKRTRVISEQNLAEVHRPVFPMTSMGMGDEILDPQQATGLVVVPYRGRRMIFHTGCFGGYKSIQSFIPSEGLGVVVLTNTDSSSLESIVPYTIYDALLGEKPVDWEARCRAAFGQWGAFLAGLSSGATQHKKTKPSHTLADYAGRFDNPVYGTIEIASGRAGLTLSYHGFTLKMKHYHYDVFETIADTRGISFGGFKVTFLPEENGEIKSFSAQMGFAPRTVFTRVATKESSAV